MKLVYLFFLSTVFISCSDSGVAANSGATLSSGEYSYSSQVVVPNESSSAGVLEGFSSSSTDSNTTSVDWCSIPSNCGSFVDGRDGITYKWTKIGTQTWMAQNLAYLPSVNDSGEWSETLGRYYVYGLKTNDLAAARQTANYLTYGVLYNYPAAQTACPSGWHLPDTTEWKTLLVFVQDTISDGSFVNGDQLKSTTEDWNVNFTFDNRGTDEYALALLPSGYVVGQSLDFNGLYETAAWWTSNGYGNRSGCDVDLVYDVEISKDSWTGNGLAVRCVLD